MSNYGVSEYVKEFRSSITDLYDTCNIHPRIFTYECGSIISEMKKEKNRLGILEIVKKRKLEDRIAQLETMKYSYEQRFSRRHDSLVQTYKENGYADRVSDEIFEDIEFHYNRTDKNNYVGGAYIFLVSTLDGIEIKSANYIDDEEIQDEYDSNYGRLGSIRTNGLISYPSGGGITNNFEFNFCEQKALIDAVIEDFHLRHLTRSY